MSHARQLRLIEAMGVLLFFIQALRAVISAVFSLLYDYGFEGTLTLWSVGAVVLMAAAFLAPLVPARKHTGLALVLSTLMVCAARPLLNLNELMPRYWAGLAMLAAGGIYLAALIRSAPSLAAPALAGALMLDQILRALGDTFDLSLRPDFLPVQVALGVALAALSVWLFISCRHETTDSPGTLGLAGGLALGAAMFLLTSLLTLPNAVARWSDYEYAAVAPLLVAITCLPLMPPVRTALRQMPSTAGQGAWLVVVLAGLIVGYQRWGFVSALGLLAACAVTLLCVMRCVAPRQTEQPDRTGVALALGLLLLMALNLLLSLAFTYPYTVRLMQGMGLPVYLIAALGMVWGGSSSAAASEEHPLPRYESVRLATMAAVVIVMAVTLPISTSHRGDAANVTAVTYTLRYGFDSRWHFVLDNMARAIEQSGADVVTLQEVDTGRLTSLGVDDVYYLARRLHMREYYLPTVERLTGIAVLSRLPVVSAEGHLVSSQMEQTGIAHMHVSAAGRDLHVYGTWLGIRGEDTQKQITEVVKRIGDHSPTVLGGAFNTEPGSSAYGAINAAGFDFAAFGLGAPSPHVQSRDPVPHTDYVFLRGLNSLQGWLPRIPATNHKLVAVRFALP